MEELPNWYDIYNKNNNINDKKTTCSTHTILKKIYKQQ